MTAEELEDRLLTLVLGLLGELLSKVVLVESSSSTDDDDDDGPDEARCL